MPITHLVSIFDNDPTTLDLLIRHYSAERGPVVVDVGGYEGETGRRIDLFSRPGVLVPSKVDVDTPATVGIEGPASEHGEHPSSTAPDDADPPSSQTPGTQTSMALWTPEEIWEVCRNALAKGASRTSALWLLLQDAGCGITGGDLDLMLKERRLAGELAFDGDAWSLPVAKPPAAKTEPKTTASKQKAERKRSGRPSPSDDGIVAAIGDAGEISSTALAVAAGVPKGSISYRLGKLLDAGVVERVPDSKLYRLVSGSAPAAPSVPPAPAPHSNDPTAAGGDPLEQAILDVVETCTFSQRSKGIAPSAVHSQLPIPMRSRTNVHEVAQLLGLLADAEKVVKVRTGHYAPFGGS